MTELSLDQKLTICSNFIRKSPPGELHDVLHDVSVLLGDERAIARGCSKAIREYSEEQLTVVNLPISTAARAIISDVGKTNDQYYDPSTGTTFSYDPLSQKVTNVTSVEPQENATRSSLQNAMNLYVGEHYPEGTCTLQTVSESEFVIVISSSKIQPTNFWSGNWRARYAVSVNDETASIHGWMHTLVHYFEDGNVQVNSHKDVHVDDVSAYLLSASEKAKEQPLKLSIYQKIVSVIMRHETDFQLSINDRYLQLSETTFRSLRRALPVTKTRIDWPKIQAYKLGGELSRSTLSQ